MLFDHRGNRKYLTADERQSFLAAADTASDPLVRSFCWALACTGARISEVRSLSARSIFVAEDLIVIECLKRRQRGIYRAVPVPHEVIDLLEETHGISALRADPSLDGERLWPWCRTTAWKRIKEVCLAAQVPAVVSKPKSFRHCFGVVGVAQKGIPLGTMKRWLGHSRLESTLVYTEAVGEEERALADRMWRIT